MYKSPWLILILLILSFGCSKQITSPNFIDFKIEKDSVYVIGKNHFNIPLFIKTVHKKTKKEVFNQLKAKENNILFSYPENKVDTNKILKRYNFLGYYGKYPFTAYDTNFVYTFPFKSGYKTKVIQGYDGNFSHYGDFSAKTIDFEMKVGDTIVAARDGIIVKVSQDNYKQGTTSNFKEFGNYIMIYHKDNTFSQYVHLKQYGSFVKAGDSVKAKQPIALSGFTGWTTTPHLHFGVYKPTDKGLVSIPIIIDSLDARILKRGDILIKN